MSNLKYFVALFMMTATSASAQNVEMADGLRADGKIYVIVLIILIILGGLISYLFAMDRKLKKMEKSLNERAQTKSSSKSF